MSTPGAVGLLAAGAAAGGLAGVLGVRGIDLAGTWAARVDPAWWTAPGAVRVEDVLELAAVTLGTGVAAWFCVSLLVAAACTGARVAGRRWGAGERWVDRTAPRVVRRALVVSAGTGLALSAAGLPALALAPPPDELGWAVTLDHDPAAAPVTDGGPGDPERTPMPAPPDGVPAPPAAPPPDATAGGTRTGSTTISSAGTGTGTATPTGPHAATGTPPPAAVASGGSSSGATGAVAPGAALPAPAAVVTVRPGDTLWDIASEHLPPGATVADVAAAWPTWYAANAGVVGADPDLIHPGQRLVPPVPAPGAPADGADR